MLCMAIMERVTGRSRPELFHNAAPPRRDSSGRRRVTTAACPSLCLFSSRWRAQPVRRLRREDESGSNSSPDQQTAVRVIRPFCID
jgi:hypothetical protein